MLVGKGEHLPENQPSSMSLKVILFLLADGSPKQEVEDPKIGHMPHLG